MKTIVKAGLGAVSAVALLAAGAVSAHEFYQDSGYGNSYYGNQFYNNGGYYQQRTYGSYRSYQPRASYGQSYYGNGYGDGYGAYDHYRRSYDDRRGGGYYGYRGEHRRWHEHHDEGDED